MTDRRVLIVDDDPAMLKLLSRYLADSNYEVLTATDGQEALGVLLREGPSVVLSDLSMPGMNGLQLCQAIRSSEGIGFVYIIILTADCEKERVVEALEAGANDFLAKPFHHQELLARLNAGIRIVTLESDLKRQQRELHKANAELAILNRKLEMMAISDELTSLSNRREAMAQLKHHWVESLQSNQPFSCIMLDIDRFKSCNDTYGHDTGDEVLKQIAGILARCSRAGDLACRIGGEEFLVLCPNTTLENARGLAERLRAGAEARIIQVGHAALQVTLSAGVAERTAHTDSAEHLLKCADQALYQAKRGGRNRVVTFSHAHDPDLSLST